MSKFEYITPRWHGWTPEDGVLVNRRDWEITGASTAERGFFNLESGLNEFHPAS